MFLAGHRGGRDHTVTSESGEHPALWWMNYKKFGSFCNWLDLSASSWQETPCCERVSGTWRGFLMAY